jgi:hypothetical protein
MNRPCGPLNGLTCSKYSADTIVPEWQHLDHTLLWRHNWIGTLVLVNITSLLAKEVPRWCF